MPQFTSTKTSGNGLTVSTVIDTETNTQTITVTTPDGKSASATESGNFKGNFTRPSNASISGLVKNLEAQGATDINLTDVGSAARASSTDAVRQKEKSAPPPAVDPPPADPPPADPPPATVLAPAAETTQPAAETPPPPPASEQAEAVVTAQVQTDIVATTNPSQSELDSQNKLETAEIVDLSGQEVDERAENLLKDAEPFVDESMARARSAGLTAGAEKIALPPTNITVVTRQGSKMGKDLRVKLRVPPKYLEPGSMTSPLISLGGIIFPYTPTISYEAKADYGASNPMHSNFPINFYQRSSTSLITISGKFSVQNTKDARIYLATMHLLKALIRMRSGGANNGDSDSGAPPPVCRLDGYGAMMLENVPVAVTSYRAEFPDSVDYFTIATNLVDPISGLQYDSEKTSVPTLSTIAITCLPMYSREEMQKFSVTGYLNGAFKGKGFI
jgi:hypothetical protein